jgi:hypothetical protein
MLKEFKPTYLYIKCHNVTGKLYFGKTTLPYDKMLKYLGSGDYWKSHIRKHGIEHVVTIWSRLFFDKDECTAFAVDFSTKEQIVESEDWANFRYENGLDGGNMPGVNKGVKRSAATRALISKIRTGSKQTAETCKKRSTALKGRIFSSEHIAKLCKPKPPRSKQHSENQSRARKGVPWSEARRNAQKIKENENS